MYLEAVKSFSPVTTAEIESLHKQAVVGAILLGAPKFEHLWLDWVGQQTQELKRRSAQRFVRILELGEWLPQVEEAVDPRGGTGTSNSGKRVDLIGEFLQNEKRISKSDLARSHEGTCAHAIACATVWASFYCDRSVPAENSILRRQLDIRAERYRESQYADANYLTLEFHRELEALAQEAAVAFTTLLTPAALGIYLRFSIAIQYGPPPQPSHLVAAILRLQALDGGPAAALCAYLIGSKLKPQFVHRIAMALDGGEYPAVDMASAAESLGLVPLDSFRENLAEPIIDSDGVGLEVVVADEQTGARQSDEAGLSGVAKSTDPEAKA